MAAPRSPVGREPSSDWPPDDPLVSWWPELVGISGRQVRGSGLRLASSSGPVHLKRRPITRMNAEVAVLAHLAGCGLPVTVPLPTRAGRFWQPWDGEAVWLYRELPGASLQLHMPDGADPAWLLGGACAHLGRALGTIETADARRWRVPVRPNQSGCAGLPAQVIHRDFHAGNVLFSAEVVSGYLDFDHVEVGPRVLDLCYAATSLLALMITGPALESWLGRWGWLVAGYIDTVDLSDLELDRTAELMLANQYDFVTWFESRADADNLALTLSVIEYVEAHSQAIVAEARRSARETLTARDCR